MTAMITMRDRYQGAMEFEEMLATAETNAPLWKGVWRTTAVPDSFLRRVASLGGAWHLLVLSEDWCGDAANSVPVVAKLAEQSPNVDLRILARDRNLDLMETHLTGSSRSIPVVLVLDEQFNERGWWGPRPRALQDWVLGPGKAMEQEARYREVRARYARDKGLSTLEEVVATIEAAAAARIARVV